MKNVKLEALYTQDIQLNQGNIIESETKFGLKRIISIKRIKEDIIRNINIIINIIHEYYHSIKEIFLYYFSFFINIFNNSISALIKKRNNEMMIIKRNEIKNIITRKNCNDIIVNKQKYNKIYNKGKKIYIYIIIIFSLIIPINNNTSYITLTVKGPGLKKILSSGFNPIYYPNKTIINEIENTTRGYEYYLPQENNTVKLIWYDNNIYNCNEMFYNCQDITEIDLSYFNTSEVTNMTYMFLRCTKLTSLNLSNFNTSKVTNM